MHDVAVLELQGSVKISDKVSTVCLPTEPPKPGTKCYVTGLKNIFLYYYYLYKNKPEESGRLHTFHERYLL